MNDIREIKSVIKSIIWLIDSGRMTTQDTKILLSKFESSIDDFEEHDKSTIDAVL